MQWVQNYSAVGNRLGLTALVASLPICFLFWMLSLKRVKSYVAGGLALLLMFLVAIFGYGMPARAAVSATVLGVVSGLWPIGWIILTAVFFYNVTVEAGQSEVIQSSLSSLTDDRRIQALLIAFCFSAFLEGVSGEGAPVAVAASMLIGLGFPPALAAVACLVANTPPVPFGPVGVPTRMMISVTNIDSSAMAAAIGLDMTILAVIIPFFMLIVISGLRRAVEVWPATFVAGLSYALTCFFVCHHMGVELPAIISSLVSMICLTVFLRFWKPSRSWQFSNDGTATNQTRRNHSRREVLKAWSAYLSLLAIMSLWEMPLFTRFVQHTLRSTVNISSWPWLDGIVYQAVPIVESPTLYRASYRWDFLTAPGTAMLICAIVSMAIFRVRPARGLRVFKATLTQLRPVLVMLATVVGIGYLANYSGMSYTLGLACATYAKKFFPVFSPAIGWIGVFLTGSVTSAAAVFGKLQQVTATKIGLNPVLTTSASLFGGVAAKLISPQSITIACGAAGLVGRETEVFRKTIRYSLVLLGFVIVVVLLEAWVVPGVIPH